MFDLTNFTLGDITELGSILRKVGAEAHSMEEAADGVVRRLYETLVDPETNAPSCALVRFFKTHSYGDLDDELREFAQGMLDGGESASPELKCLTLLSTAGDQPEWNDRKASISHRAIPLASREIVARAPMISSLLHQLGVEVEELIKQTPELLVERDPPSFNVFYVPHARGSVHIPEQQSFVAPVRIASVLGFGGMLPTGDIFVVILFSKVPIPRETAQLFRTLALNVKVAVLPFDGAVFERREPEASADEEERDAEGRRLRARIGTLHQLLEVYERSVLEQSDKLYAEREQLRLQTTLLENQGEASLSGVLSVSLDGRILSANRRLAEHWSVPRPQIGDRYDAVLRSMSRQAADPDAFLAESMAAQAGGESSAEVTLADGRTFDRYTAPILDESGENLGRVWRFRDITALKQINQLKDDFISAVSHELRTPLTSIRGSLDLMTSGVTGTLPNDAMNLAKIAQSNCERLTRLVNDVLDIEKIEAGHMDFRLELVGLGALAEQTVVSMRPYGAELGIEFRFDCDAPGALVHADPDRLTQVLENLLSNAAKFSPQGGEVRVRVAREGSMLRVAVADRGEGISDEHQEHVFEKFSQIGSSTRQRARGTGLGLNIARAIVEQLGGEIGVCSAPGKGSVFHFDLPEWQTDGERGGHR